MILFEDSHAIRHVGFGLRRGIGLKVFVAIGVQPEFDGVSSEFANLVIGHERLAAAVPFIRFSNEGDGQEDSGLQLVFSQKGISQFVSAQVAVIKSQNNRLGRQRLPSIQSGFQIQEGNGRIATRFDMGELRIEARRRNRDGVLVVPGNLVVNQDRQAGGGGNEKAIAVNQPQQDQQASDTSSNDGGIHRKALRCTLYTTEIVSNDSARKSASRNRSSEPGSVKASGAAMVK